MAADPPWIAAGEPNKGFTDVTEAVGLKGMSGGVAAWGDFDNDGWVDLCVGGEVWRNEEGKRFKKVGQVAGPAIWGDYDNDGYLDLFCFETGKLFRNLKGREVRGGEDLARSCRPRSASAPTWGDFNGDGFLDLYVGGYEVWPDEEFPDVILTSEKGERFVESWRQTTDPARPRRHGRRLRRGRPPRRLRVQLPPAAEPALAERRQGQVHRRGQGLRRRRAT